MKEQTLWVIAPVRRQASPGIFSFPICQEFGERISISVKCFCLQRSDENHKQSQTRFLVCYGLKQVNMFFDNQKFNLWKRQPSAVGESWDTAPSEFPPCFFFFRRGFASQRLDYSKIDLANTRNAASFWTIVLSRERNLTKGRRIYQVANKNNTTVTTKDFLRFSRCYLKLCFAVLITLRWESKLFDCSWLKGISKRWRQW